MRNQNLENKLFLFDIEDRKKIEVLIQSVSSTIELTIYEINDMADKYAVCKSDENLRKQYRKTITPYIIHRAMEREFGTDTFNMFYDYIISLLKS